jgi:hypothetical protein
MLIRHQNKHIRISHNAMIASRSPAANAFRLFAASRESDSRVDGVLINISSSQPFCPDSDAR